ncbi:MAG: Small subunit (SSU) processome component [Cyphobasidiales sp. Tagirdzhanova-0007]|nr:MAG: Small subunit (SSU) processome component [Cyphobasidiales sp. Tagirdzhanova-0007]
MQGSREASTSTRIVGNEETKPIVSKRRRSGKAALGVLPRSTSEPSYTAPVVGVRKYLRGDHIQSSVRNKKLSTHLSTLAVQQANSANTAYEHDSLLLAQDASSRLQPETDLERTWKVSQGEITSSTGLSTARKSFKLRLDEFGPYEIDYTADGR